MKKSIYSKFPSLDPTILTIVNTLFIIYVFKNDFIIKSVFV